MDCLLVYVGISLLTLKVTVMTEILLIHNILTGIRPFCFLSQAFTSVFPLFSLRLWSCGCCFYLLFHNLGVAKLFGTRTWIIKGCANKLILTWLKSWTMVWEARQKHIFRIPAGTNCGLDARRDLERDLFNQNILVTFFFLLCLLILAFLCVCAFLYFKPCKAQCAGLSMKFDTQIKFDFTWPHHWVSQISTTLWL